MSAAEPRRLGRSTCGSDSRAAADSGLTPGERRTLEALLAAHAPADASERVSLGRIEAFAARHPDPFDRGVREGHLTGSAFVVAPDGRLLLTHHRKLDLWLQLGGHAEGERDAAAVAAREAREESGLPDVDFHPALLDGTGRPRLLDVDVHSIPARADEPEHDHHDLRFLFRTQQPDAIRANPRESRALEWVALDEALRRGDPGLARAVRKVAILLGA